MVSRAARGAGTGGRALICGFSANAFYNFANLLHDTLRSCDAAIQRMARRINERPALALLCVTVAIKVKHERPAIACHFCRCTCGRGVWILYRSDGRFGSEVY